MSVIDLRRRLDRIEAIRGIDPPTRLLTDRPHGDPAGDIEAADVLANWQSRVAQGRATVHNGVLCPVRPEMTESEWAAAHVTAH